MNNTNLFKRILFFEAFLVLFGFGLKAQVPELSKIELPDEVRTINALLSNNDNGLLLATGQGLYEYDGVGFKRFYEKSKNAQYQINCLAKSESNIIWWGTYSGVLVKFSNGRILESFDLKSKCKDDNYLITSIAITKNAPYAHQVLVTTSGGEIISLNQSTKQIEKLNGPDVGTIYAIKYGFSPMIWLCTSDGFYTRNKKSKWKKKSGLYTAYNLVENLGKYWAIGRDEQKKSVFMLYYSDKDNAPPSKYKWKNFDLRNLSDRYARFYEIAFTENEVAWITTNGGLIRYNPRTASSKFYSELNNIILGDINHISVQNNNSFWISSAGKRLYKIVLK